MKIRHLQLCAVIFFCCTLHTKVLAQNNYLLRSTTSISGASEKIEANGNTYLVQQVIGQSAIGTYTALRYDIRQGFIQPNILNKIVDVNVPTSLVVDVYPNPFKSSVFLEFEEEIKSSIDVVVYNMMGVQILSKLFLSKEKVELQLDQLPSGEYIIKARTNNMQFISKILKQ